MFATSFFSIISFYAKQAFNYGSTNNQRTARFLYNVRWITFSAQVPCLPASPRVGLCVQRSTNFENVVFARIDYCVVRCTHPPTCVR